MNRQHETETVAFESPNLKQKVAARIAPAVALLLWGEQVFASVVDVDDLQEVPTNNVPEPTTLALLAAGAAGAAIAAGIKKRRKK